MRPCVLGEVRSGMFLVQSSHALEQIQPPYMIIYSYIILHKKWFKINLDN
jgi:hypothetical protein